MNKNILYYECDLNLSGSTFCSKHNGIHNTEGILTQDKLEQWYSLRQQTVNGYHMSDSDKRELIRLNHLIMEASHKIHNDNMLNME